MEIAAGIQVQSGRRTVKAEEYSHLFLEAELAVFIAWEVGWAFAQNLPFDVWGWV